MFETVKSINNASNILNMVAKKQKIIGENIANVDTPNYTRKNFEFSQFLGESGCSLESKINLKLGFSPVYETKSGEPVNMANEIMDMQKNSMMYNMATRHMNSIITQMKTVINVGK